ncbi:MAG TPA: tRNA (adenosine(37)-N6)-threonylcarbamoyltransferase complex dimerization subunit type 1 TsaB [Clostridiales bacterium]|nr:MAG: tRNA (adenosine(37)-N6)-threonylcarbamoyltransferase complex dimerization subunit type 1 TsaB [Clostridiales bacterium GWD2_32_19]HCC08098.1 tRNA (adenosine(37)-N6)-threonylcarbamoyltransferase complex dimerization subunit type 1 TsaB [Clostridiales bacterium]
MYILSIDTASNICSVAIGTENGVIIEKDINKGLTHSELLMPMVEEVISGSNINKKDIDLIIVAKGPGSFTGLRIGVTAANTFGQLLNIPVIGITTLDGLAIGIGVYKGDICPIIDAKGGKIYTALYRNSDKLNKISDYQMMDINDFKVFIKNSVNQKVIFTGDGVKSYREYIDEKFYDIEYEFADNNNNFQKAGNLIKYVLENKELLETKDTFVNAYYIKKSQAEK